MPLEDSVSDKVLILRTMWYILLIKDGLKLTLRVQTQQDFPLRFGMFFHNSSIQYIMKHSKLSTKHFEITTLNHTVLPYKTVTLF